MEGYGSLAPMRAMWAFVATALVLGSCAQKDWIDRTLVTVDVTVAWSGVPGGPATGNLAHPGAFMLDLRQEERFRGFSN